MVSIISGADDPISMYLMNGGSVWILIAVGLAAYFIGNISPSILMARARGIDIKKEGSGNAGTTNALRVMGKKAGLITLIVDVLKGTLAVMIGGLFAGDVGAMICVITVFCGHIWPVFLALKAGKAWLQHSGHCWDLIR